MSVNRLRRVLFDSTLFKKSYRSGGFTLVELAVVMIIIGLLIGGVLKGQALIESSQLTKTATQITSINVAVLDFRYIYYAFPGDMLTAEQKIPNCTVAPCVNGSGNGIIDGSNPNFNTHGDESRQFWAHLNAAGLFSGGGRSTSPAFGEALPEADIGGGYVMGHKADGNIFQKTSTANVLPAHYAVLRSNPIVGARASNALLRGQQARYIDEKIDDGMPNNGFIRAIGDAGAGGCASDGTAAATYNEGSNSEVCSLFFRIDDR